MSHPGPTRRVVITGEQRSAHPIAVERGGQTQSCLPHLSGMDRSRSDRSRPDPVSQPHPTSPGRGTDGYRLPPHRANHRRLLHPDQPDGRSNRRCTSKAADSADLGPADPGHRPGRSAHLLPPGPPPPRYHPGPAMALDRPRHRVVYHHRDPLGRRRALCLRRGTHARSDLHRPALRHSSLHRLQPGRQGHLGLQTTGQRSARRS